MGSRGNRKHQQESSIITKGAGKFGSLPNHKGCHCNTMESNRHGNSDRDEERARAMAKGNGRLTAMVTATATKMAY